jgi:transcriptional regulator with PAS, ATPase and Fis domain
MRMYHIQMDTSPVVPLSDIRYCSLFLPFWRQEMVYRIAESNLQRLKNIEIPLVVEEEISETKVVGKLAEAEEELVRITLLRCNGNKSRTARELGISRRSLLRRLDKLKR